MKQLKIITALVIAVISTMLFFTVSFTSCRKNADNRLSSAEIVNTSDSSYKTVIDYRINTVPSSPQSIFQWTSGQFNTRTILFNAAKANGDAIEQQRYWTWSLHTVDIMTPTDLGTLKVPALKCDHASFSIELGISEATSALVLNGNYRQLIAKTPDRLIPVRLIINETIEINTIWLPGVVIAKPNYIAQIQLSLDQLTSGIDASMMNAADITGDSGTILISATSNPNLYSIILGNLENNTMNVQFWPQLMNSAVPANE